MSTTLETRMSRSRSAAMTWLRISEAVRFRASPSRPDAQKLHPIRHPTCVETQTVYPCLYFMSTDSIYCPSRSIYRYFTVSSRVDSSLFFRITSAI